MTDTPPAAPHTPIDHDPRPLSRRGKRLSWVLGLGVLLLIALGAYWLAHRDAGGAGGPGGPGGGFGGGRRGGGQPTTVGTTKAVRADLPVMVEALGTVTPMATATVSPQVSGTITDIRFREGQMVRKGDVLAVIEQRPYRAALLQAQGALERDQAQLANARLLLKRYDTLLALDSVARQDRDTQAATVRQLEGTIAADRGAVEAARVNLQFTEVRAPVDGRVGLRVADVGNYIGAGATTGVAVVTTIQPIDVAFTIPQQQAPAIQRRIAAGAAIPAVALDQTRTTTLDTGRFSTLDNRVDTTTGTIKGKARMANPRLTLYPNQFVNLRLMVDTVRDAVTVPPSAVRQSQDHSYVWLLKPDRTVTERKVTTGVNADGKVQITDGLALGETVITDGGDRLTEGATVRLPGDKPAAPGAGGGGRRHRRAG
ncbi:efflux RND transporter periplasmic adaptor subunit [Sphingomonas morindae]|uniref:Efflux RND transporter periplasmic adaptor subunit n=1 Tax=Sphingomonas morindae TaxID=1541170 RepID=A0ABY4XCB1_9SPHN|nr:efflux RND transporter periplasmic adaptor subunit [Sphingomonas morindae]USI74366.1 efflux RND transporter periplasmic adaptor subunit [Sphingomonas morindae]